MGCIEVGTMKATPEVKVVYLISSRRIFLVIGKPCYFLFEGTVKINSEEDIFKALDMEYVPPEKRNIS